MSSDGPFREVQASGLAPPVPSSGPAAHGTRGSANLSRCRQLCNQAGLYSSAWVHLGGSMLPADFILLTNSVDNPRNKQTNNNMMPHMVGPARSFL
jgi:hypothetical protein